MTQHTETVTWHNHPNKRVTTLVKAQKSPGDTSDTFYVLVGNTGGEVDLADSDEAETLRIYRRGACVPLAHIIHLLTGHPIALFTDPTSSTAWAGHAAVQLPTGDYLDLTGETTSHEILSYYRLPLTITPTVHTTAVDAQNATASPGTQRLTEDEGILPYMLHHMNELGFLTTLHFAQQLLTHHSIPYDENTAHTLAAQATKHHRTCHAQ